MELLKTSQVLILTLTLFIPKVMGLLGKLNSIEPDCEDRLLAGPLCFVGIRMSTGSPQTSSKHLYANLTSQQELNQNAVDTPHSH